MRLTGRNKPNCDKNIWCTRTILITLAALFWCCSSASADPLDGTATYRDYLFVLVHGVHSKSGMWDGTLEDAKYREMFGNLKETLEKNIESGGLGLQGRVYNYTFSNIDGSNLVNAREFGDRLYSNPDLNGESWLNKARSDFIEWYAKEKSIRKEEVPESAIPTRYIILTHSMGNLSVRSYIYSDHLSRRGLFERGFYQDDIAKVVFIAPPFLGSEAIFGSALKYSLAYERLKEVAAASSFLGDFFNNLGRVSWGDPSFVYNLAKKWSAYRIYEDEVWDSLKAVLQGDLVGMGSVNVWDPAAVELMPFLGLGVDLQDGKLADPLREPAYSIVYGRGVPSPNFLGTGAGLAELQGARGAGAYLKDLAEARRITDKLLGQVIGEAGIFLNNDFALTLMPHSGFWQMPTEQGKFLSLLMGTRYLTFTNDGDFFVPTWSAKGEGIEHLRNARRYEHVFKSEGFENYLSGQFKAEMSAATAAYYASKYFGVPDLVAALVYWSAAFSLIDKVEHYRTEIKDQGVYAHGSIIKQYDLIKTAILDTPAIFTVDDLQTTISEEETASQEATAFFFSAGTPVTVGHESVKVRSLAENRGAVGSVNLPVPMTLNGERKYIASMTVTRPPQKIAGKLNYLIPRLMRSFEYSFNFSAWKPIAGVNPETGEFVLENLPFAEGQNVLAIRAENAVGVKSHQLLKVVLNTIPLLPRGFTPEDGKYLNNDRPLVAVEFNKSEYTGNYEEEKITIKEMLIDGVTVEASIESRVESYHPWARASYQIPAAAPLAEGLHQVSVRAESNVGSAQGLWSFYIDRSPPLITLEALQPFGAAAPLPLRFSATDQLSPHFGHYSCQLLNKNNQVIVTIASGETLSRGEEYFNLDPATLPSGLADGEYRVSLRISDLAGNTAEVTTPLLIDRTPPVIITATATPNPVTSLTEEAKLVMTLNEQALVTIKLTDQQGRVEAFLAQTGVAGEGGAFSAVQTWRYDNAFAKGLDDGLYRVELTARDAAGNESASRTIEGFHVDRTPPKISGAIAAPYVMANSGANPYWTTLSYYLDKPATVTIEVYHGSSGQLVERLAGAPGAANVENRLPWSAVGSDYPKGVYRFQISAVDRFGNRGTSSTSVVKEGMAPEISFPAEEEKIFGTIAIRGVAVDPDWSNDMPFGHYRVYYKKGVPVIPAGEGLRGGALESSGWENLFIEVPSANRSSTDPKNLSRRPLQNSATLAYLQTAGLENGEYTILLVVEEERGELLATAKKVQVDNEAFASASLPHIQLQPLPEKVVFQSDDSVKLPLSFTNSVKPANVYVEIAGEEGVVFSRYLPNIFGAPFIGRPAYQAGRDLGYFFWKDSDGYHLRWSSDGSRRRFSGSIALIGGTIKSPILIGSSSGVRVSENSISWDTALSGGEGGLNFTASSGQLMLTGKIDEDPESPQFSAERLFLGAANYTVDYQPVMIDLAGQRLVDLTAPSAASARVDYDRPEQLIEWDGKTLSGAYVDNGRYLVRVRAEGADGFGVATAEALVELETPFSLSVREPANREFSPLSLPDSVSLAYNLSKDSLVSAVVFDASGREVCRLLDNQLINGNLTNAQPHTLSWRGNYPGPESGTVVSGGRYRIVLTATARDGSGRRSETIDGIIVTSFRSDDPTTRLESLAEEGWAAGESPYFLEVTGRGKYYPPEEFTASLNASGTQLLTAYPYVPFAGLMHRGFNKVYGKVKAYFLVHCYRPSINIFGQQVGWAYQSFHKESDFLPFELSKHQEIQEIVFPVINASDWEWYGITSVEVSVEVFSSSEFVLDSMSEYRLAQRGAVAFDQHLTSKGVFKIKAERIDNTIGNARIKILLSTADPIAYSRLTNRFLPFVGFVSALQPEVKDFSYALTDINKGLGFPGKLFFEDPAARPGTPYLSTEEVVRRLSGLPWEGRARELARMGEESSLLGHKDSLASAVGYDKYLSDEYYEFIPITSPEGGELKVSGQTGAIASTTLLRGRVSNPPSAFSLSWPWQEGEYERLKDQMALKRAALEKNPQLYTGNSVDGTFWGFDQSELDERRRPVNNRYQQAINDVLRFDRSIGHYLWRSAKDAKVILPVPDYIDEVNYRINYDGGKLLTFSPETGNKSTFFSARFDQDGQPWSTGNDLNLSLDGGKINSGVRVFNQNGFSSVNQVSLKDLYQPRLNEDYLSAGARQYTFLKKHPFDLADLRSPLDNPYLVIDGWETTVKDLTGGINQDIYPIGIVAAPSRLDDLCRLKLKLGSPENRYLEISGSTAGPYELSYYDGSAWKNIQRSLEGKSGRLAWWNVSRLNGKYTVLLRSGSSVDSKEISIGTPVGPAGGDVYSAYRRAHLKFPPGAFTSEQLVTLTPVSLKEIYVRNRPIIMTTGPIVEIKPSPWQFSVGGEGVEDQRPTLKFFYSFDELKELGVWDGRGTPSGIPWNIHQLTAAGDLQVIGGNYQEAVENNGERQYVFAAPLDHFSTYALLPGRFSLSAPLVFADRLITNKDTVAVYGTAEPGSIVTLYIRAENSPPQTDKNEPYHDRLTAEAVSGNFRFSGVRLLQEGENYIFVTSHPPENKDIRSVSDLLVIKDALSPSLEVSQNLSAFSPDGDSKYDAVEYLFSSNEKGRLYLTITGDRSAVTGDFLSLEISLEANREGKIVWGKEGVDLYRRDLATGTWLLATRHPLGGPLKDGLYRTVFYAIDEAGNISENIPGQVIVDTVPPMVMGLNAAPNPFTPNDDGDRDFTRIWYKLSEPAYVKIRILRDDDQLFRFHEGPTENFLYPTHHSSPSLDKRRGEEGVSYSGDWSWDGRGSRNELIGGNYHYYLEVEDWVGNKATSEVKTIEVDREPTLIPYAYAEPDPFAPVNPENEFTEIKFFLGRNDLRVDVAVIGRENQVIKDLLNNALLGKGEHSVRWYGDFCPDYQGETAEQNDRRVADGSYQFRVRAVESGEGVGSFEAFNTVLVDNIPPRIIIKSFGFDRVSGEVTLQYYLSKNASVEISVYNKQGIRLETLVTSESLTAGEHQFLRHFPSGEERFLKIIAVDRARNRTEERTGAFSFSSETRGLVGHASLPPLFTPNGDGRDDLVKISYTLGSGERLVALSIITPIGSLIKKIIDGENQGPGTYNFYWDGKNEQGALAADGDYQYLIAVSDVSGVVAEGRGDIRLVAARPVVGLAVSSPFQFNYTINYPIFFISGEALVKLEVLNASVEAVWNKVFSHAPGNYVHEYNGLTAAGHPLPEGDYLVRISAQDPLGTLAIPWTVPLSADYTAPLFSSFAVVPNPASLSSVNGSVKIKFQVNEPLGAAPLVGVAQNGASPVAAILSAAASREYEYQYEVLAGYDGPALITVEALDLAGNTVRLTDRSLLVDTAQPVIYNLRSEVKDNPDFSKQARIGATVAIRFQVSEALKFDPEVRINGQPAAYRGLNAGEYLYEYALTGGEADGKALISISGLDLALNQGTLESSSSGESFVIDLVPPEVLIGAVPSLIALPGAFSTNANPDGSDLPRSLQLFYGLSEPALVTLSVHKIPDNKNSYQLDDFNSANRVVTLINREWRQAGEQSVSWDGRIITNDGWADPGKYAFIVEGRDRAGNLTERKWGGTFWVRNNFLALTDPDKRSAVNNPEPKIISPGGNSDDPAQRRGRVYFYLQKHLTPEVVTLPERIEAFSATDKKIGRYSVKIYNDPALTGLVKSLSSSVELGQGGFFEDWDGRDQNGLLAPDGEYYLAVEVEDYAGNPALGSPLVRSLKVDNTPPTTDILTVLPAVFAPAKNSPFTTLTYEVNDNSGGAKATVSTYQGNSLVKTLFNGVRLDNGTYSLSWDGSAANGYVGSANGTNFVDGAYAFEILLLDDAGNTSEVRTRQVLVDTTPPSAEASPGSRGWLSGEVAAQVDLDDQLAGIKSAEYAWSGNEIVPEEGWSNFNSGEALRRSDDGTWYLHVKATDQVNNQAGFLFGPYRKDAVAPTVGASPESRGWGKSEISVTVNASDGHSGLYVSEYVWSSSTTAPASGWSSYSNGQALVRSNDGTWYLHLRARDNVGNLTSEVFGPYRKDTALPSVTASPASRVWNSSTVEGTLTAADPLSGLKSLQYAWSSGTATPGSGWTTVYSGTKILRNDQGSWYLHVRGEDNAGNITNTYFGQYQRDSVAPALGTLSAKTFNPYVDSSVRFDFTASDAAPSSGLLITNIVGRVKSGSSLIRTLTAVQVSGNNYYVTWDGLNSGNKYENEGDYTLELTATDGAGNSTMRTTTISLRDDQRLTSNSIDSVSPYIIGEGSALNVRWIEGWDDSLRVGPIGAYVETSSPIFGGATDAYAESIPFTIDYAQSVEIYLWSYGLFETDRSAFHIRRASDGVSVWWKNDYRAFGGETHYVELNPGTYYLAVRAGARGMGATAKNEMKAWFYDRKYNRYSQASSNLGQTWGGISGPVKVDSHSAGPSSVYSQDKVYNYSAYINAGNVYYRRMNNQQQLLGEVKLTNSGQASNPGIAVDSANNCYVVWDDSRHGKKEIYFQKVPFNFAPISGGVQGMAIKDGVGSVTSQSATLEAPRLVSPKDQELKVSTIRPNFQWRHRRQGTAEYRLDLAKNEAFSIAGQSFLKSANSGSPDKNDPELFYYNYQIHQFDPGLDRDTYYWRVTALTTTETATSEVWSFTIEPELSLSGVTNYPNPFDPNRERTKIRYRLGADADEVVVRIYNLTGSLVRELVGETAGEGSDLWSKYNDLEWDGKNDRGDLVLNGIYPFEITARAGDRTLTGRGKIAVLK